MSDRENNMRNWGGSRLIIFDEKDYPIVTFPIGSVTVEYTIDGEIATKFHPEPEMQKAKRSGYVGLCLLLTAREARFVDTRIPAFIEVGDEITITDITLNQ